MTDEPGAEHLLAMLEIARHQRVAIAVSPAIGPERAAQLAEQITARLDQAGVPPQRRSWIIAAADNPDAETIAIISALSGTIGPAPLTLHDPRDPDQLIFRRRPPNQRRGGVYLNAQWMQSNIRIACGAPADLAPHLAAWFNNPATLNPANDLDATLML